MSISISDFDISDVQRAIEGDQRSLERVAEKAYVFSCNYFRKEKLQHSNIVDLAQDVSIRVIRKLSYLNDYKTFFAWLRVICKNTLINLKKKITSKHSTFDVYEYFERTDNSTTSPATNVERSEMVSILNSRIAELSDVLKITVYLFYFEGKLTREISKSLSVPESTVRRRLHEAREKLRGTMGTYEFLETNSE